MKVNKEGEPVGKAGDDSKRAKRKEIFMKLVDMEEELHNKIFSNQTGMFPYMSSKGTQYVMVMLDYDSSYIMMEGLQDCTAGEMVQAY